MDAATFAAEHGLGYAEAAIIISQAPTIQDATEYVVFFRNATDAQQREHVSRWYGRREVR